MFTKRSKHNWPLLFVVQVRRFGVNGPRAWATKNVAPTQASNLPRCDFHYYLSPYLASLPNTPDDGEGPYSHANTDSDSQFAEPKETIFINRIQLRGLLGKIETSNEPGFGKRVVSKFRIRAQRP